MKLSSSASNLTIERFERRIPGFNRRSLSLDDLTFLCDLLNIYYDLLDVSPLHGCSLLENGEHFLFVNEKLTYPLQVIAGFHELTHLLTHPMDSLRLHKSTGGLWNLDKQERQAQTVGMIALMPSPLVYGLDAYEVMERFDVSFDIAMFRLSLPF